MTFLAGSPAEPICTTDKRFDGVWTDTACTQMQTDQGQVDDSGRVWTMHGQMTCPQHESVFGTSRGHIQPNPRK